MSLIRPFSTASLLCTLIPGTALADITPQDVWKNWQAYATAYGLDLTANIARSSDSLQLTNIRYAYNIPLRSERLSLQTGTAKLSQNADGTVSLTMPKSAKIKLVVVPATGPKITTTFSYTHENQSLLASGTPDAITYDFNAESLGLRLESLDGPNIPQDLFALDLVLDGISGASTYSTGDLFNITSTIAVDSIAFFFEANDPDETTTLQGTVADAVFDTTTSLPKAGLDVLAFPEQLRAGLAFHASASTGRTTQTTATKMSNKTSGLSPAGNLSGTQTIGTAESEVTFSLDKTGVSIATTNLDYTVDLTNSGLPFPVQAALSTTKFTLVLPLLSETSEQDFSLGLSLENLHINDEIWAQIDPDHKIPRTPATLSFDLAGKARLLVDLLDFAELAKLKTRSTPPAELTALTLNAFTLFAAMSELSGSGAFTFDNSDMTTFKGLPAPTGSLDVQLSGSDALLDILVDAGLLSENDAMGARMMRALVMKPSERDDILTSTIDITPDGHISANGQRLK